MTLPPNSPRRPSSSSSMPRQSTERREIYRDQYVAVAVDNSTRIISSTRTSEPFPSLAAFNENMDFIIARLNTFDRSRYAFLSDLRAASGRNDPTFESGVGMRIGRLIMGFRRVGVLVRTAVGALQVHRLSKSDEVEVMVSTDEDALLRYLTGTQ